jgi:prolyl-tRNA synthetase
LAILSLESVSDWYGGDGAHTLTVGKKYRDEKRPRAGLLRAREFLMKDMYSFDLDENAAMETYKEVRDAYDWFFKRIGLPFVTV